MSKQLIICLSGKKRSGKNTATNFVAGMFLLRTGQITNFRIDKLGLLHCNKNSHEFTVEEGEFNEVFPGAEVKLYSFADCLKEFCINVLGLTYEQCYGTEEQKNSRTNLHWSKMPTYKDNGGTCVTDFDPLMTGREVLQYFGTDIIRKMCDDAWVNGTINKIKEDGVKLAIITDCRFPNEVEAINQVGGKTIRLLRNVAGKDEHVSETVLDDFPKDKFSLVVDNRTMDVGEQCEYLKPHVTLWLNSLYNK